MTPPKGYYKDLTGKKFGLWTVLGFYERRKKSYWLCKCACPLGTIRPVRVDNLRDGNSASCGCTSICLPQPQRDGWIENGVGRIQLTQDKVTEVDSEDVEELQKWKWQAHKKCKGNWYAERDAVDEDGNTYKLHMARWLLGMPRSDPWQADHIDKNSLNNRRLNLRRIPQGKNLLNKGVRKDSRTGVKGTSLNNNKPGGNYSSHIKYLGVYIGLGSSSTLEEASRKYAEASRKLHGKFGRVK